MTAPNDATASMLTVIAPRRRFAALELSALWQYRDLWWRLAVRDLQVRYKQTLLGAGWAVIQPFATMMVLHLFFGRIFGMAQHVGDVAYPVFLYAGLLPWTLFANAVTASSNCFVNNAHIITKVYFPRLLLPLAAVLTPIVDYAVAFVVLLGMMAWFAVPLTSSLILLPLLIISTLLAVLGVGIALASMTVSYRDVRHAVPFMLQLWFFMTPVIYPLSFIPAQYQWLANLNPMAGTIAAFRSAILGQTVDYSAWAISTAVAAVMLTAGLLWFSAVQRRFADVI
jgi:lipopolysaccharide transport system permease protein